MGEPKKVCVLVEGLPGCGKTEICKWIAEDNNIPCFLEDEEFYPNDFKEIAGITQEELEKIQSTFPFEKNYLQKHGSFIYINLKNFRSDLGKNNLYTELKKWEFGNEFNFLMDIDYYSRCSYDILNSRYNMLFKNNNYFVLDGSWLQNIVNEFIYRNYLDENVILNYCKRLLLTEDDVTFLCVYLEKDSVRKSLDECFIIKGQEWFERVLNSILKTPFGVKNMYTTDSAIFDFFENRYQLEQFILNNCGVKVLRYHVDILGWEKVKKSIEEDMLPYL